jgi:polyhydroxyalkanoate synthesis regulator phasin
MDFAEYMRRRTEQVGRESNSLQELADELLRKRDSGEITEEESDTWSQEIGKEMLDAQFRSLPWARRMGDKP